MQTTAAPIFTLQPSGARFHANHGWLKTYHSFSFADYFDPANLSWGALRVFNEDTIEGGQGFPTHPHRDMEILTYVFAGRLEHRDSMGNHGVVGPGGVQFMSAGTGVRHSEFNASADEPLHLVQMWVVPGRLGATPSYGQVDFNLDDRLGNWLAVASGRPGVSAPIALTQDATLLVSRLDKTTLSHAFDSARYGFLFAAQGEITVRSAQGEQALRAGDALRLYGVPSIEIAGSGEIVFWDVPPAAHGA